MEGARIRVVDGSVAGDAQRQDKFTHTAEAAAKAMAASPSSSAEGIFRIEGSLFLAPQLQPWRSLTVA